jgi:hypothetical protein
LDEEYEHIYKTKNYQNDIHYLFDENVNPSCKLVSKHLGTRIPAPFHMLIENKL